MTAQVFQPIPARPAPNPTTGWAGWVRTNLFSDWKTSLGTAAVVAVLLYILPRLLPLGRSRRRHRGKPRSLPCCPRRLLGRSEGKIPLYPVRSLPVR